MTEHFLDLILLGCAALIWVCAVWGQLCVMFSVAVGRLSLMPSQRSTGTEK